MFEQSKWNKDNGNDIKNCVHSLSFSQNLISTIEKRDLFNAGNGNNGESKLLNDGLVDNVNIFRQMVSVSHDAIIMMDNNSKVSFWNNAAEKIFGYTEEEILNKNLHEILTPKFLREASKKGFEKFRSAGEGAAIGQTLELTALKKNGEEFPIELSLSAFKIDDEWNSICVVRDITERKENEEKIKQQAAVVNNNPAPVLSSNKEGIIIYANPSAKEIYGSEIIDNKINTIFIGFDETLSLDLKQNHFVQFEDIINDKTFLFTVKEDIHTNAYYFHGIDISDKKRVEEELRKSEEKFKSLVQNSSLGIYRSNKIGEILFVNPALLHMLGYETIADLQRGKKAIDLYVDPEEREFFQSILEDEGTIFDFETKLKKRDGTEILVNESSNLIKNQSDKDIIYQGIVQDISKQKKDEVQIKKLYRAIEQSNVSVVITDSEGIIEYVNPKCQEVTGYTKAEAIGVNSRILNSGEQSTRFYKNLWDTIKSGNVWTGEFHNKKKNGELFWEAATISPVKDENGSVINFVAVKEDITRQKALREELIAAKEKAERSDRMKSEFIAQMSHEIRTPVNVLSVFSQLLLGEMEECDIKEDMIKSLNNIDMASARITRTMDTILNFSEIQSGNYEASFEEISLNDIVIRSIYSEYKDLAKEKGLKLNLINNIENSKVLSDKYSITQIFSHLIDNAIKYTEAGKVEIKLSQSDNLIAIEITDTGIGISEEYLPELYTPFSQESHGYSRKYDGNGIGLALVKKYCDLNNIEIKVNSIKNKGTSIHLTFNNSIVE